ncbi:MAG: phosphatase PAP2 family protein [Anaerolineae bacterium]|nr:phosphatase PAP2 family protein [Anaerolineae bacterium]
MDEWLESLIPWGTEALVQIQSYCPDWVLSFFRGITFLGQEEFYLLLLPLVYWCVNRRIGAGLAYLLMLSTWLNSAVKYLFAIPRPDDPRLRFLYRETSPSFPSGHSQSAVTNWSYLAFRFRRGWMWAGAVLLALLIGVSRMVLAVHFPQDLVGGWTIGIALLLIYAWAEPRAIHWLGTQSRPVQLALAALAPLVLIVLHPADVDGFYPASDAITPAAALAGIGVGIVLERAYVRFDAGGPWHQRLLRLLLGMVIVVAIYALPKLLLPADLPHGAESVARFVRYVLIGWATGFFCPWLFVKLGLAARETEAPAALTSSSLSA